MRSAIANATPERRREIPCFRRAIPSKTDTSFCNGRTAMRGKTRRFRFGKHFVLASIGSNLVLVSRRQTRIQMLFSHCVDRVQRGRNMSRKMLFPRVVRLPTSRTTMLRDVLRSLSTMNFSLDPLNNNDCTVGNVPSNVRKLGPMRLIQGVMRATVRGKGSIGRRIRAVLTSALTHTTTVICKRILDGRRVSGLISGLFTYPSPGCAPSKGAILTAVGRSSVRGLFSGWKEMLSFTSERGGCGCSRPFDSINIG